MEDGESSSEDSSDNSLNNLYLRKASSEDVDKIIKIYDKSRDYLDEEDEEWIRSIMTPPRPKGRGFESLGLEC